VYTKKNIGGKDVYTVESHHRALEAWAEIRRRSVVPPNLITLDQHTDTLEPFLRYVGAKYDVSDNSDEDENSARIALVAKIDFMDGATVKAAVGLLHNDEHIQAATRSGIINVAFVVAFEGTATESDEEKEFEAKHPYWTRRLSTCVATLPDGPRRYSLPVGRFFILPHGCRTGCTANPHDDNCHYAVSSEILEPSYLKRQLDWAQKMASSVGIPDLLGEPYILDIDLDFFHTRKALNPEDPSAFHHLIRNALGVTIATETECTEACWLDPKPAPIYDMLQSVYGHIEAAMEESP
jgi:hypothetical protein